MPEPVKDRSGRRSLLGGIRWRVALSALVAIAGPLVAAPAASAASAARLAAHSLRPRQGAGSASACPWADPSFDAAYTPQQLATMVDAKMTLGDKLDVLGLHQTATVENVTTAVPSLCIPVLTLQDGPDGLAYGDLGVTQLPATIGLAATFDPGLAEQYGAVVGNEARRQGIDVVQGPNLNIARVPESGRLFEGFGEDPYLVSQLGVADIEGIQSAGVMADAKHYTGYTQETDRAGLKEEIGERALQEIYLPPFKAAVEQGDVASIMCAYGAINDVNDCSDKALYDLLYRGWGFKGFVRSDLVAVPAAAQAFAAGLDQIKPAAPTALRAAVRAGDLSMTRVDRAVERVLAEMFAYHLIDHPLRGHTDVMVTTRQHEHFALTAAEESMVLLKDRHGVLPLKPSQIRSVAVIGDDADAGAVTAGRGGAHVVAMTSSPPLQAIRADLPGSVAVRYENGGSTTGPAAPVAGTWSTPLGLDGGKGVGPRASHGQASTGNVAKNAAGTLIWHGSAFARTAGTYVITLTGNGNDWLSVNGVQVLATPGVHGRATWSISRKFKAGERLNLSLRWYPVGHPALPVVGIRYAGDEIADAAALARRSSVAIVFVSEISEESFDRPTLALPSDEDALIEAVAAANHHTIVVVNSGGAVLMPWLSKVAGVLEAWYPGEEDGAATAAVLLGRVDPSGHLPITFPKSNSQVPTSSPTQWPGVDGTVDYSEGLDVGYRWYDAHGADPLFPFGYGLSYTSFQLSGFVVTKGAGGYSVNVNVTNTGKTIGTEVVQAYLGFPATADEPPENLVGFARATVLPGATTAVTIPIPAAAFQSFVGSSWQTLPGQYTIRLGVSSRDISYSAGVVAPTSSGTPPAGPAGPTKSPTRRAASR